MAGQKIDLSSQAALIRGLRTETPAIVRRASKTATNSTARAARTRVTRIAGGSTGFFNLSTRQVFSFTRFKPLRKPQGEAVVTLEVKPIPLKAFPTRVQMRTFTVNSRGGGTHQRRLPAITVERYRGQPGRYIQAAFPIRQRRTGRLRKSDVILRRDGAPRLPLTVFRGFTFPDQFINENVRPDMRKFIPKKYSDEVSRLVQSFGIASRRKSLK